ncbi:MAG: HD-GYP domain-containing protein [Bacillota bacterium]|nr:HD-GYP domain-containing protein [Bacillota bacterium]
MSRIKKFVTISELRPGMILAEDVVWEGTVLVGSGVVVSDIVIDRLRERMLFGRVAVFSEEEVQSQIVNADKEKTIEDVEVVFTEFSVDIERIFNNVFYDGISDIEEVRNFAKKVQDQLNSVRAVIKNIVLYGSGTDSIYRHSVNVAALSYMLGKWVGFDDRKANLLTYAGILHDFGKTKLDRTILDKPSKLTPKELEHIKSHPVLGYNFVKKIPNLDSSVSFGVLMHHERLDGTGYPLKMKAEKIHDFGRIVAIADIFDAINSNRFHKKSKGPFEALEIIQKESLGRLDYQYSKIFLEHIVNYYMGEQVRLNTDKICRIVQVNLTDLSRPLLFDGADFIDLKYEKDLIVEELVL